MREPVLEPRRIGRGDPHAGPDDAPGARRRFRRWSTLVASGGDRSSADRYRPAGNCDRSPLATAIDAGMGYWPG
jgi:hypothetical protein